jgi:hypothetical protein
VVLIFFAFFLGGCRELDLFKGLSFTTISSTGPNGAIIHYSPDPNDCDIIKKDQVCNKPWVHGILLIWLLDLSLRLRRSVIQTIIKPICTHFVY